MANPHSFPASQKLKSRKTIASLFESGKTMKAYPLRAVYSVSEYNPTYHAAYVQMGISVPKRSFKRAVDRNRIKRQVREAYRKHHSKLLNLVEQKGVYLAIMMIYVDRKEPDSAWLEQKMISLIRKMEEELVK